jgi:hypothetical protein
MVPTLLPVQPRVVTAIDTAALAAVGNAVRHARQAERHPFDLDGDRPGVSLPAAPVPVPALTTSCDNGEAADPA